ncbi:hypothetical protein CCHR01_08850 [Colletotrichum chrysophilum]|uniref:Secreted protein n=1 Tax=Colletotrichum chrysophilum TaxID=1836956 RepID=A0AAD9EL21_9PEZI|nr:hypothetical protein CCHR01_08850 [Colletotrichum chrysophilum]
MGIQLLLAAVRLCSISTDCLTLPGPMSSGTNHHRMTNNVLKLLRFYCTRFPFWISTNLQFIAGQCLRGSNIAPLVLLITVLSGLHPALHSQGNLARLLGLSQAAVDGLALPGNGADGADNGSGSSTKGLDETSLVGRLLELLHGVLALRNHPALGHEPLAGKSKNGVTGDTLEDGAVEGRGDELLLAGLLVLDGGEHVHGTDLGDVLLLAEEPQVLLVTAAGGLELGNDAGSVVGAELLVADTAGPGADGVVGGLKRNGLEAGGVVGANGGGDDVEQGRARRTDAEGLLGTDHRRAQVQRVAPLIRDEVLLEVGELGDELDHGGGLEGGQSDTGGRLVEAGHVLVRAEESDLTALILVSLHALETLESVVEDAGRGVEREVLVGDDLGVEPSRFLVPLDGEHVVCGARSAIAIYHKASQVV